MNLVLIFIAHQMSSRPTMCQSVCYVGVSWQPAPQNYMRESSPSAQRHLVYVKDQLLFYASKMVVVVQLLSNVQLF